MAATIFVLAVIVFTVVFAIAMRRINVPWVFIAMAISLGLLLNFATLGVVTLVF